MSRVEVQLCSNEFLLSSIFSVLLIWLGPLWLSTLLSYNRVAIHLFLSMIYQLRSISINLYVFTKSMVWHGWFCLGFDIMIIMLLKLPAGGNKPSGLALWCIISSASCSVNSSWRHYLNCRTTPCKNFTMGLLNVFWNNVRLMRISQMSIFCNCKARSIRAGVDIMVPVVGRKTSKKCYSTSDVNYISSSFCIC